MRSKRFHHLPTERTCVFITRGAITETRECCFAVDDGSVSGSQTDGNKSGDIVVLQRPCIYKERGEGDIRGPFKILELSRKTLVPICGEQKKKEARGIRRMWRKVRMRRAYSVQHIFLYSAELHSICVYMHWAMGSVCITRFEALHGMPCAQ